MSTDVTKAEAEKIIVVLVGSQGSGKTTWCEEHLADHFRISQDEQGPNRHLQIYTEALERGEPRIVIDRTNARKSQRERYLSLARAHGYRTKIIWLNVDREECLRRCHERESHPTLKPDSIERAIGNFHRTLEIPTADEVDEWEILEPSPDSPLPPD